MTREYEKSFEERSAVFIAEQKRIREEVEKSQKELKDVYSDVGLYKIFKTDLDIAIEELNREIKAKTMANLELIEKNSEASADFSKQRQREEETLKDAELRLEGIMSEIAVANETLKKLEDDIVAKQDEAKTKGSEVAGYLAELSVISKEASAKKDALLSEVEELFIRRGNIIEGIQEARTDLDSLNQRIEVAKVDMAQADADLNKQRATYAENIAKFKDLDALRSDIESKQDDIKFREEQMLKRAKALNEQEARIKQMKG
jgi:chromosome segregation ATPase